MIKINDVDLVLTTPMQMHRFNLTLRVQYLGPGSYTLRMFQDQKLVFSPAAVDAPLGCSVPLPCTRLAEVLPDAVFVIARIDP